MNFNALIAVLILKSVITQDEGQRLVEHLNDKPQSTVLKDAISAVAEVIGKPANVVAPMGPVGPAQQAEELAARNQVTDPPLPENGMSTDSYIARHVDVDDKTPQPTHIGEKPTDSDQNDNPVDPEPSNDEKQDKPASDEPAKPTSDDKPKEDAVKK